MNLEKIQTFGGPVVQKAALKVSKYAPEILTGVGIVGTIGGAILGARATLKLEALMLEFEQRVSEVKHNNAYKDENDPFYKDEAAYQKALAGVYVWIILKLTKLYGPAFTLEVASIASILGAHGIMRRRQVALLAAYKTVEAAFGEYRKRVIEEFGPDKDRDYRLGIREDKIEDEDGKKRTVRSIDPNAISGYAKFFDEGNLNYNRNPELNMVFLKSEQNYANDRLRARGFLFLNEVYGRLSIPETRDGAITGWTIGNGGDNYVDFGIFNGHSEKARDFVNGLESSILLDFNVDGVILDLI